MASMNMIHQLIDISQEQYERHKQEVDQLTQRIDDANWGDITTKNYAILNNIIDNYEADIIQRKNRKFRRDLRDYQQGRVYTFSKKYDHVQDSNLSLDTTSCPDSIPSSEVETSDNSDRDSSIRPKVNFLEEARRFRFGSLQESRPKPPDITTATPDTTSQESLQKWEANLKMASMNMIHQLIDISQEQYERHKQEVDQLTQRIDDANWGDITTKNYAILNNIIDNYEADIIQRKN
ncbi:hypothetical protein NDU88_003195 [Pleurodeles waltl]|uniref:Uncharacterized protein n=1 Tax=Pleurodeles waltl TaxID=8319 RepID=A0AAV7KXV4_PLEWA|nr:hypothetical protein NDU88_003195 [Pleurodeles waltl]